jgi:hypothetical protein
MGDDIRDVSRTSPFSPLKGVSRSGARERLSDGEQGPGGEGRDTQDGGDEPADASAAVEELVAEVQAANARLAAGGKNVRLRLAGGPSAPVIDVLLLEGPEVKVVSRRIAPSEIASWVARIETSEGLLLDDTM